MQESKEHSNYQAFIREYLEVIFLRAREINAKKKQKEEVKQPELLDFTKMFKRKVPKVRKKPIKIVKSTIRNADLAEVLTPREDKENLPNNSTQEEAKKQQEEGEKEEQEPEEPEYFEIPMNLTITQEEMRLKRCLDVRRWFALQRPQYSKSCGISSLVSCWNYLYSTLGVGTHSPLSQEEALTVLGFQPPFSKISFGPFTGNSTLVYWFKLLNAYFGIKNGKARVFWKLHGKNRTIGLESEQALTSLKEGLLGESQTFIYHCFNHYMVPIGFEETPTKSWESYKKREEVVQEDTTVIIGEPSRPSPCFRCIRWSEIVKDIDCQNPYYYNIRKPQLGIQCRKGKRYTSGEKLGSNMHCLIVFEKTLEKEEAPKENIRKETLKLIEEEEEHEDREVEDEDGEIEDYKKMVVSGKECERVEVSEESEQG